MLIIYVKLLRPGDYDGTVTSGQTSPGAVHDPVASDKPVSWDRVAHALNSEFIMWKEKYPGVHLNVHKRNGKSCRSRWKYHVSLAVGAPSQFVWYTRASSLASSHARHRSQGFAQAEVVCHRAEDKPQEEDPPDRGR